MSKKIVRIGPFKDLIASGVQVGNTAYLSGQVSVDDEGKVVAAGDLIAQGRQVYANVAEVLGHFCASVDDIVDEAVFVTDMRDAMEKLDALVALREEVFGRTPDATQTMVQVVSLVDPELLIEIKCVAMLASKE